MRGKITRSKIIKVSFKFLSTSIDEIMLVGIGG